MEGIAIITCSMVDEHLTIKVMLLTLLTSKKSRVSVKFLLPTSYQLKAMLVNYHNFDKQSPGAMI